MAHAVLLCPEIKLNRTYSPKASATIYAGDRLELLLQIPDGDARLVVTSPPYNIGKKCEKWTIPTGAAQFCGGHYIRFYNSPVPAVRNFGDDA